MYQLTCRSYKILTDDEMITEKKAVSDKRKQFGGAVQSYGVPWKLAELDDYFSHSKTNSPLWHQVRDKPISHSGEKWNYENA